LNPNSPTKFYRRNEVLTQKVEKIQLAPESGHGHILSMSSVAEIESAISKLPQEKVDEIAVWLDEYRQLTRASAEIFSMYDKEEAADA
jgi:hypothetical protein